MVDSNCTPDWLFTKRKLVFCTTWSATLLRTSSVFTGVAGVWAVPNFTSKIHMNSIDIGFIFLNGLATKVKGAMVTGILYYPAVAGQYNARPGCRQIPEACVLAVAMNSMARDNNRPIVFSYGPGFVKQNCVNLVSFKQKLCLTDRLLFA